MKNLFARYKKELDELHKQSCSRKLISFKKDGKYIFEENKKYLNLSSNDYLGIAENKDVLDKFFQIADFSLGSTSSRLLTGSSYVFAKLECVLAALLRKDKALIFNSGYHANTGILSALASKNDVIFSDKLNHASIIDGIKLSEAKMFRYKHLDYNHLETLLKEHRDEYDTAIIVSESLFSMDGDIADLNKLVDLKKKYNAILLVDEAHAFGVFGEKALGLAEEQGVLKDIDLFIATFGKAVGSVGAFCAGHDVLINYLINKCRPLIFSTALPDINVAFSYCMITEIIPNLKKERKELLVTAQKLREKLQAYGLTTTGSSQIVPVILGSNETAVKVSKELIKNGYYLLPIRHPTVAKGSSRVRISLRADISFEEVEKIPEIIKNVLDSEK